MTISTQSKHPWRATARTVFQGAVGMAALAAPIYTAVTHKDSNLVVGGFVGAALAVSAAVTMVMAMPAVEAWIAKFLPFLATQPPSEATVVPVPVDAPVVPVAPPV